MKLTMLGTGHALTTKCYNTCFILENNSELFLVDGGGGNGILQQMEAAHIASRDIHHIFVTHKHIDHIMGIFWMIRVITSGMCSGKYDGEAWIYGHDEVIRIIRDMSCQLLQEKELRFIDERLHFAVLEDGMEFNVLGSRVTAFDIHSTKAKQFGFSMRCKDKTIACCGDEPYHESERKYVKNSDWLLHEAFCLHSESDLFRPYEKHHSTVRDACETAARMNVKNLILYHTEDTDVQNRKERYMSEGKQYYRGNLYVPDDLESIRLWG